MGKSLKKRFDEKYLIVDSGCWEWQANKNNKGYGMIRLGGTKPKVLAHRVSWELTHGEIKDGLHVLHKCDNPGCVNPDHLFLGTHADNMRDKDKKGRSMNHLKSNPGSSHGKAKLKEDDICVIVKRRLSGDTYKAIAKEFGVSLHTISDICNGRSWTHVDRSFVGG